MTCKVVNDVDIKTPTGVRTLRKGQIIRLTAASAAPLIEAGKIAPVFEPVNDLNERMAIAGENTEPEEVKPYVTEFGVLVIPWNSDPRYHYWNGGQSLCDTLKEIGRCGLIDKYKSLYCDN